MQMNMTKGHIKSLSRGSEEVKKRRQQLGSITKVLQIKYVDEIYEQTWCYTVFEPTQKQILKNISKITKYIHIY